MLPAHRPTLLVLLTGPREQELPEDLAVEADASPVRSGKRQSRKVRLQDLLAGSGGRIKKMQLLKRRGASGWQPFSLRKKNINFSSFICCLVFEPVWITIPSFSPADTLASLVPSLMRAELGLGPESRCQLSQG